MRKWRLSHPATGLDWSLLLLPAMSVYALVFLLPSMFKGKAAVLASLRQQPVLGVGVLSSMALMLLSGWLNHSSADGQLRIMNWLPYIWFFWVFQGPLGHTESFLRAGRWMVYGAVPTAMVAVSVLGLRWFSVLETPAKGRVQLHFGNPNWLAGYLILAAGVGWMLRRWPGTHAPTFWRLASLICVLGAATAQSRNSISMLLTVVGTDALLSRPLPRWCNRRLVWGLLLVLAFLSVWLLLSPERGTTIWDFLDSILFSRERNYTPERFMRRRQNLWQLALEWICQSPFWGLGPGGFTERFAVQYPGQWIAHPHNFWLVTAVEYGVPAMLVLFGSLVWAVAPAVRQYVERVRSLRRSVAAPLTPAAALIPLLTGLLVFNLVDNSVFCLQINLPAWCLLTAATGIAARYSKARAEQE